MPPTTSAAAQTYYRPTELTQTCQTLGPWLKRHFTMTIVRFERCSTVSSVAMFPATACGCGCCDGNI